MKANRRFGGTCRFHLQDRRIRKKRNQREAGSKKSNRLAEISDYVGKRREMQEKKSVSVGWPIGQNEPIGVQEQLASSH
jgi:hypothetical protein